jgi:hypothetical protein
VKADFKAGYGLSNWTEPARRKQAVEKFIAKISSPNPKPKSLFRPAKRRSRFRTAGYEPCDCLSVRLRDGRYGAAYIVATRSPDDENGSNVVVDLDYLNKRAPTLRDFTAMKPLRLTHGAWNRKLSIRVCPPRNKESDTIASVVGNLKLRHRGYEVEFAGGNWVNWAVKPDASMLRIYKQSGIRIGKDDPSLYAIPYCDWDIGAQQLLQDEHNRKKSKHR